MRSEDGRAFILGKPFFASYTVVFDYELDMIEIYDKFNITEQPHASEAYDVLIDQLIESEVLDYDMIIN